MLVRVNQRLLLNLAREYGRVVSKGEAEQLLIDAGFTPEEQDRWIVDEENLNHLNPDEVSEVEILDKAQPPRGPRGDA